MRSTMTSCTVALLLLLGAIECWRPQQVPPSDSAPANLVLVQTITRHGDRVATKPITVDPAVWTCTENTISLDSQEGAPDFIPLSYQSYRALFINNRQTLLGNCSAGQLTSIGQNETYNLGLHLANQYRSLGGILPLNYSATEFYARSSATPRCQQSARNMIEGLFAPVIGQQSLVVPVWLIESETDDMQINIHRCPAVVTSTIEFLLKHPDYVVKMVEPLVPYLHKLKNIYNTTRPIIAAYKNYDNCNCRTFHDIPLPNGMSQLVFNAIRKSYWVGGSAMFNASSAISVGAFIQELVTFMDNKVAGQLSYNFQLFSGHDTTVGPILAYFDLYDGTWPPYASHIQFNLFEKNSEYYVNMYYNDKPLIIPACGQFNCSYDTFRAIALANVPINPTEACDLLPLRKPTGDDFFIESLTPQQLIMKAYADVDRKLVDSPFDESTLVQLVLTLVESVSNSS